DWRQILALVVGMGKDADKPTAEVLGRAVGKLSNIALKRFGEGVSTTVAAASGKKLPRPFAPAPTPVPDK
ncbi:MAG: hypothetical protein RR866_03685, partial [Raoultibacter sp.]